MKNMFKNPILRISEAHDLTKNKLVSRFFPILPDLIRFSIQHTIF